MKLSSIFLMISVMILSVFTMSYAFADASVITPGDFFTQVLAVVQSFGGLSTLLKISGVVTLVIASMKVSFLNQLIWSKLGAAQVYLAPVLGLVAGIIVLKANGSALTAASVFAFMSAGAGSVFLHEILDTIKAIPGLGAVYVSLIGLIESALGGPSAQLPLK